VLRKHSDCVAGDEIQAEVDRCFSKAKAPSNATHRQHCQYVHIISSTTSACFLLLLRYVPNVAKSSTWDQCIYWGTTNDRPTDQRPTDHSNGHISATGHPIHFMFRYGVGFSFGVGRSNGPTSDLTKSKITTVSRLVWFWMALSLKRFIRSNSYLVLG